MCTTTAKISTVMLKDWNRLQGPEVRISSVMVHELPVSRSRIWMASISVWISSSIDPKTI